MHMFAIITSIFFIFFEDFECFRYTGKNFIASGLFSFDVLHLCYYHKQRENISFGVEFESSARSGEAVTTIGYQVSRLLLVSISSG